jgi:hypothetical protein
MSDTKKLEEKLAKLASIVVKQQKIIQKMAQYDPKYNPGQPGYDPKFDPMNPSIGDYNPDPEKPAVPPKPAPAPVPMPKPGQASADDTSYADDFPPDFAAAVEANAPQLKGSMNVNVSGSTVSVKYNSNRVKGGPNAVKSLLQQALAGTGYLVNDVVGVMDPEFKANF